MPAWHSLKDRLTQSITCRKLLLFVGLIVLAMVIQYSWDKLQWVITTVFLERDLDRASELLNGHFIFFGPEVTGGGNLPGPFFYFLLTPPLFLGLGFLGGYYWMCFLVSLGGVLGWYFFRAKFDSLTGFLWLIMYTMLFTVQSLMSKYLNPSFSPLFIILVLICMINAFVGKNDSKRGRSFVLACFFVGLAIQTHYSTLAFIFSLILLQVFSKRLKIPAVSKRYFFLGLAAFGLTIFPYFVWVSLKYFGIEVGQPNPYDGVATNSIPSLVDHFRVTWDVPFRNFLLLGFKKILTAVPISILAVFVLVNLLKKQKSVPSFNDFESENSSVLRILNLSLFLTFIPFSFYFFVPQGHRYGAPFAITMLFFVCFQWRTITEVLSKLKLYNVLCVAALLISLIVCNAWINEFRISANGQYTICLGLIFLVVLFQLKEKFENRKTILISFVLTCFLTMIGNFIQVMTYRYLHQEANTPRYEIWNNILPQIYQETGWSYTEAMNRIYFINIYREQSFRSVYEQITSKKIEFSPNAPDGFFIGISKPKNRKTLDWILEQPIAQDIKEGLLSGNILIGEHKQGLNAFFAPFTIVNKNLFTSNFHNVSWGYNHLNEEKLLRDFDQKIGVKKITDNQYLFKWNECQQTNYYCDTAVILKINRQPPGLLSFEVEVVGLALSQNTKWINPLWTQAWIAPYVEVKCGKEFKKLKIAHSIGYNRRNLLYDVHFKYPTSNNSLLAPFKRNFEVPCEGKLSEIIVGRESSEVESEQNQLILPETKLNLKL